jgi:hypothetical protein
MFYFSVLSKDNNHLSAAPMSFCLQNDRAIRESPLRRSRTINENLARMVGSLGWDEKSERNLHKTGGF